MAEYIGRLKSPIETAKCRYDPIFGLYWNIPEY